MPMMSSEVFLAESKENARETKQNFKLTLFLGKKYFLLKFHVSKVLRTKLINNDHIYNMFLKKKFKACICKFEKL